jgi:sortase A
MKKHLPTILLCITFLIGLALILYPTVSDRWNALHQSQAISEYTAVVQDLDEDSYAALLEAAQEYNQALTQSPTQFILSQEQTQEYESILNVSDNGIMGYIEIPSIDCYLPIYHGTEETTLQSGAGHLAGSSFPVGGESTHCVISGHRGLPSARLFTDLNELVEGDQFVLHVLDETLTYEVDQILIVEPAQIEALAIVPGEDLCTLVTCTPYGINTHRLLVRGHRVETEEQAVVRRVSANAVQMDAMLVAAFVAVPLAIIATLLLLLWPPKASRKPTGKK